MAIFRFFKTAAAAILDFSNFKFLPVGRLKRATCVVVPNLVEIGQTIVRPYVRSNNKIRILYVFYDQQ